MNRWNGLAYLTRDPELVKAGTGITICRLRVAVKRAGRGGGAGFFDVTCFEEQAATCARYLKKGRDVAIEGRLSFEEFETRDGVRASRVSIIADRVEFLSSPRRDDDDDGRGPRSRRQGSRRSGGDSGDQHREHEEPGYDFDADADEDVPF